MIRDLAWGLYWRVRAVVRLYQAASWRERRALTAYAARELAAHIPVLRRRVARAAWIRLGGFDVLVALGRYELGGYMDVWLRRLYERAAEFRGTDGWTVVDVGANVGFYTLRQVALGARVVALEPNPDARGRLRATIERNGIGDRVRILPFAAGRAERSAELAVGAATVTGTIGPPTSARERFVVEVRTLDSLLGGQERVDLLKIDTEGAEVDVLSGAVATLRRTARVVLEWHTPELRAAARALLADGGFEPVRSVGAIDYYRRVEARS